MAYVRGEKKITKTVEDETAITAVYRLLESMGPQGAGGFITFGSTRFDSHGYVAVPAHLSGSISLWRVQRAFPKIEFKIVPSLPWIYFLFRTHGSTGWHPGM